MFREILKCSFGIGNDGDFWTSYTVREIDGTIDAD
jgi:hypothetical protein